MLGLLHRRRGYLRVSFRPRGIGGHERHIANGIHVRGPLHFVESVHVEPVRLRMKELLKSRETNAAHTSSPNDRVGVHVRAIKKGDPITIVAR